MRISEVRDIRKKAESLANNENNTLIILEALGIIVKKHPDKAMRFLNEMVETVTKSFDKYVKKEREEIDNALHYASYMIKDIKNEMDFISMTDFVMYLFPEGIKGHSEMEIKVFKSYENCLITHQDQYIDSDWALNNGYNDYLKMILRKAQCSINNFYPLVWEIVPPKKISFSYVDTGKMFKFGRKKYKIVFFEEINGIVYLYAIDSDNTIKFYSTIAQKDFKF